MVRFPELQELVVHGGIYFTTFTKKYENRQPWSIPDVRKVISFIPGTIRQILVKEGDTVQAEQKILVSGSHENDEYHLFTHGRKD